MRTTDVPGAEVRGAFVTAQYRFPRLRMLEAIG